MKDNCYSSINPFVLMQDPYLHYCPGTTPKKMTEFFLNRLVRDFEREISNKNGKLKDELVSERWKYLKNTEKILFKKFKKEIKKLEKANLVVRLDTTLDNGMTSQKVIAKQKRLNDYIKFAEDLENKTYLACMKKDADVVSIIKDATKKIENY